MIDNSNLQQKIMIRQRAISFVARPYHVCETHAGKGVITSNFWQHFASSLMCFEKEKGKFEASFELIEDDFKKHIDKVKKHNVVDMDAYGMILPIALKVFNQLSKNSVLIFTEHVPRPFANTQHEHDLHILKNLQSAKAKAWYFEKSTNSNARFGYIIK